MRSVALRALADGRRGLVWWSVGLAGIVAVMLSVYPALRDDADLQRLVDRYPAALKAFVAFGGVVDYRSGAGYVGSELFALTVPVLLIVAAVGAGARAIAGEEERGTLDLLLATPVSRTRLLLGKLLALAGELALLATVLWLALVVGSAAADLGIGAGNLAAACVEAALLALGFGTVALLAGAATGSRGVATGAGGALATAAYVLSSLAGLAHVLEPARVVSPYYHYAASDALRDGLAGSHTAVLAGVVVAAALLALPLFARRDLHV